MTMVYNDENDDEDDDHDDIPPLMTDSILILWLRSSATACKQKSIQNGPQPSKKNCLQGEIHSK